MEMDPPPPTTSSSDHLLQFIKTEVPEDDHPEEEQLILEGILTSSEEQEPQSIATIIKREMITQEDLVQGNNDGFISLCQQQQSSIALLTSDDLMMKMTMTNDEEGEMMEEGQIKSEFKHLPQLEIGSRNSAFQPYKPLTILTNLQRGNVKTLSRDTGPTHPLSFQERAAKGTLIEEDVNETNVNSLDPEGLSAVMWASFHGKLDTVQLLLSKGADVNMTSPEGQTALMFASSKGHLETVCFLISSGGADIETEDEFGNTALNHATNHNQAQVVTALLKAGANLTKPNFIGDNAFEVAYKKGHRASQWAMEAYLKMKLLENTTDDDILLEPGADSSSSACTE